MNDQSEFNKVSGKQLAICIFFLLLACFIESSCDYLVAFSGPSLTFADIAADTAGLLLFGFVIGIPVAKAFWNGLISAIFYLPRINYGQTLVLVTCIYWISGI